MHIMVQTENLFLFDREEATLELRMFLAYKTIEL